MPDSPTPDAAVEAEHPAWRVYWDADREWRRLIEEAGEAHRRMNEAADELERAGEMWRDHR